MIGDVSAWQRLVEGSPLIVALLVLAVIALWRDRAALWSTLHTSQRETTSMIVAVHTDTLRAMHDNTAAVKELTKAIDAQSRHHP